METKYSCNLIVVLIILGTVFLLADTFFETHIFPDRSYLPKTYTQNDLETAFHIIPLYFEPIIEGGNDAKSFLARGNGYEMRLDGDRSVLSVAKSQPSDGSRVDSDLDLSVSTLTTSLVNSNKNPQPVAEEELEGKVNYLVGNDPSKWKTNIPTYRKVRYKNVYSGIDLLYYGNQTQLEFDFIVAPGADPKQIRLDLSGSKKIVKNAEGEIVISLKDGDVILEKPVLYQTDDLGQHQPINGQFVLVDRDSVKFKIGEYDHLRQLVIDPVLTYSTFLPGASLGYDIAVDNDGNAIVTGYSSGGVPTTTGSTSGGVFVTKFNPQGSNLVFSTRVGGSGSSETGRVIKLDPTGNIVVAGTTSSTDFPSVNAVKGKSTFFVSTNSGDSWSNNSNLQEYQTFKIAPSNQEPDLLYAAAANRIYRSTNGGALWTNVTSNLPSSSTLQLVSVNPANSAELLTATSNGLYRSNDGGNSWAQVSGAILPGTGISAIEYDPNNPQTIYLAASNSVRKTVNGGQNWTSLNGGLPANISLSALAIDPQTTSTIYAGSSSQGVYKSNDGGVNWTAINTGISGDNSNIIRKLAIDQNNPSTVYVATGNYASRNLVFKSVDGGSNWSLIYTSAGTTSNEIGALAVSRTNSLRLYVGIISGNGGFYRSEDGGATWNRAQSGMTYGRVASIAESPLVIGKLYVGTSQDSNINDVFVFKLNPIGTGFIFSTTLGGSDYDYGYALAVDSAGNAYVGGTTKSFNFPTVNAFQPRHAADGAQFISEDGFVTKIAAGGGAINYSTYLGGNGVDNINSLAVDSQGKLSIAGKTQSPDFPLLNPLQPALRGIDAFLTKLSPTGSSLEFSTFWGTTGEDSGNGVGVDQSSNIILVGQTSAAGLPAVNALQPDFKGGTDGFVTKFSPDGSRVLFSTYFGGRDTEGIQDIDSDVAGNIYITGSTSSKDFPLLRSVKSRSPYFKSSNGGEKWSNFNNLTLDITDFGFHPTDPNVMFAASGDGLLKTIDGGETWANVLSAPAALAYSSVEFDPQNSSRIYAGYRESQGANPNRIAVSNDGGSTWTALSQFAAGSDPVYKIFVSPTDPQILYAASFYSVYKSTNGGAIWQRATTNDLWPIQDFAVNPANPSTLFIARQYSAGGIHRSLDGGATWQRMTNGISGEYAEFVVIDPHQPSTVYARTGAGIFKSTDNGDSWTPLQYPPAGFRLVIDRFSPSTLYLPTHPTASAPNSGVYRSTNGGTTWTLFKEGMPVSSDFLLLEADPRIPRTLHGNIQLDDPTNQDVFVAKLSPGGTPLIYSSAIGGSIHTGRATDFAFGVGVTPGGSAFVTGGTTSPDFPTTPGAYYRTLNNSTLFVSRFDPSWTVKGRITDQQTGSSIPSVVLNLNGGNPLATETDGLGKYLFPNIVENANFTLVPKKLGYDFTPPNYSVPSLNQDEVLNFTGVYTTYTLEGRVTFQQNPLSNVTVTLSGSQTGSTVTDSNGNFSFTVPKYGDYSVRPTLYGYIFGPPQRTFNNVTSNLGADFEARAGFAISGQILRNGNPVVGVTVSLSGSENQTNVTNAEGRYSFDAGANGNYQVTPSLEGLSFLPTSHAFSELSSNQIGDFTATRLPYTVDYITFVSENSFSDSQTEIFNVDDEGLNLQRITSTSFSEGQPAWSPNGRKLAYVSNPSGNSLLSVMGYDGTDSQVIVSSISASSPDWSPDGRTITFSGYDPSFGSNIYVVNLDGTGLQRITNDPAGNYNPNWSPDGSKIAFSRSAKIYTVKPNGTDLQRIINSNLSEDDPDWSPDGNEIVLTGSIGSEPRVYVVRVDGTGLRRLTNENEREISPSWSLTGDRIAYLRGGNFGNVYSVKVNGSDARQITNTTLRKYSPVWKPRSSLNSVCDFDGDGKTDPSIFRPGPGEWWWSRSSNGGNGAVQFGSSTDRIVPGDYTGDGKTDIAFWRPSTGYWFILRSEDFSFYAIPFGTGSDIPVPADFDGDAKADAAVFRPSTATWYVNRSGGGTTISQFGLTTDLPVAADYDGDGKADIAVYRPTGANGAEWWISKSGGGTFATQFGLSTDKAVAADYTGDGKADIAFWRPATGEWYILRSEDYSFFAIPFGSSTDIPTPGDYDGDGKTDAAVFRPSNSTWYANRSTAGVLIQQFGSSGDLPLPNAYVR